MDCNDNDYEGHNLHLVGEESSRAGTDLGSESVEMLLKAVGQEEMVPGEPIVEETGPGDQFCGMMEPMETNMTPDDKIDDVKDPIQILTTGEPHRNVSVLNQSAGVQGVHMECMLPGEEIKDTADGSLDVISENTSLVETRENLRNDTECINDGQGEPNASRDKIQDILSVTGMQNDNTESYWLEVTRSVGESNDLDKARDIETVSLSGLEKDICKRVEEDKKELNTDYEISGGSDVETVNSKLGSAFGVPSKMESIEKHAVETSINKFGDPSSVPEKGGSLLLTSELCKEDIVQPGDGSKCAAVALSVVTEIERQISGENKLNVVSPVSIQAESCIKHAIEGRNTASIEICSNSAIQLPDGQRSSIDKEDIQHGSNNLLLGSPTTYEASMLYEVQGNSSEQDNAAKDLGNLTVTSFAGGCVGGNSIIEDMKDANDVTGMRAENLNDDDHDGSSLLSGLWIHANLL